MSDDFGIVREGLAYPHPRMPVSEQRKYEAALARIEARAHEDEQLEARVGELQREAERSEKYAEERDLLAQKLEAALREIANPENDSSELRRIARRALDGEKAT